MLQRFYADNYRCLVDFELKPELILLLIGDNGTGKTTIFDALDGLRQLVVEGAACARVFDKSTRTRWRKMGRQRFELEGEGFDGSRFAYRLVLDTPPEREARIVAESLHWGGEAVFEKTAAAGAAGAAKSWLVRSIGSSASIESSATSQPGAQFKKWMEHLRPVQINPWGMSGAADGEAAFPARHLENFANWYQYLLRTNPKAVQRAWRALRPMLPGIRAQVEGQRQPWSASQGINGKRIVVGLTELSDGERSLIALYLLLYAQPEGGTLLMDEPDNFVSLREIQPWLMAALDHLGDHDCQFIVASHHPELMNQLVARGCVVLSREDGRPTRVRPFPDWPMLPAEVVARGWELV